MTYLTIVYTLLYYTIPEEDLAGTPQILAPWRVGGPVFLPGLSDHHVREVSGHAAGGAAGLPANSLDLVIVQVVVFQLILILNIPIMLLWCGSINKLRDIFQSWVDVIFIQFCFSNMVMVF